MLTLFRRIRHVPKVRYFTTTTTTTDNETPLTNVSNEEDTFSIEDLPVSKSRKGDRIRDGIRASFRENANEADPDKILVYKQRAVAALQNYLVYDSACSDPKLKTAMEDFSSRESER
eukprot:g2702.t1